MRRPILHAAFLLLALSGGIPSSEASVEPCCCADGADEAAGCCCDEQAPDEHSCEDGCSCPSCLFFLVSPVHGPVVPTGAFTLDLPHPASSDRLVVVESALSRDRDDRIYRPPRTG
jgi:hypothetical protein